MAFRQPPAGMSSLFVATARGGRASHLRHLRHCVMRRNKLLSAKSLRHDAKRDAASSLRTISSPCWSRTRARQVQRHIDGPPGDVTTRHQHPLRSVTRNLATRLKCGCNHALGGRARPRCHNRRRHRDVGQVPDSPSVGGNANSCSHCGAGNHSHQSAASAAIPASRLSNRNV